MKKKDGFTLLEMMVVLFVIGILLLLFVPGIIKQKEAADKKNNQALEKVIDTQSQVYELEFGKRPTLEELQTEGYITQEQYDKAKK